MSEPSDCSSSCVCEKVDEAVERFELDRTKRRELESSLKKSDF
jgi:hypothetical protein